MNLVKCNHNVIIDEKPDIEEMRNCLFALVNMAHHADNMPVLGESDIVAVLLFAICFGADDKYEWLLLRADTVFLDAMVNKDAVMQFPDPLLPQETQWPDLLNNNTKLGMLKIRESFCNSKDLLIRRVSKMRLDGEGDRDGKPDPNGRASTCLSGAAPPSSARRSAW